MCNWSLTLPKIANPVTRICFTITFALGPTLSSDQFADLLGVGVSRFRLHSFAPLVKAF